MELKKDTVDDEKVDSTKITSERLNNLENKAFKTDIHFLRSLDLFSDWFLYNVYTIAGLFK